MKKKRTALLVVAFMAGIIATTYAATYKVAVLQLSTSETFKALMVALGQATGATFDIQVVPSARATYLIENQQVDITLPRMIITDPVKIKDLKYDYATATLYTNAFVLYFNKSKPLDIASLHKGNTKGYKVETSPSSVDQFDFTALSSPTADASFTRIDKGQADGYLYAQVSTDVALRASGLKSIGRAFYANFELGFTILKGTRGGVIDKLISDGMKKLRDSGEFDKIMGDLIKEGRYNDWQP